MTIRLICGDEVVPREYFKNNGGIAAARSYALQCKARSEIVNALLDAAEREWEDLTITEDNFEERQK